MPTILENGKKINISVEEYNARLNTKRKEFGIGDDGMFKHFSVEDLGKIWINGQEFTGMA